MNINGLKVQLRSIEKSDLLLLHKWSNDPEIQYNLGGWHFPSNFQDIEEWYSKLSCNSTNQRFTIVTKDLGVIGTANLINIDWKNKNAFHGMLLGDKDIRGKGYGIDTVMSIMRYAFEELGLERLEGSMIEYNYPSLKLYIEKCGWLEEGRQIRWYFRKNQFWDKIIVGITRENYFNFINKNKYWV